MLDTLGRLIEAVYAARNAPSPVTDLLTAYVPPLTALRSACVERLGHAHAKTKALAVGFYNAWEAIFRVLLHPELPLTNKEAERTLRYWVIARQISHPPAPQPVPVSLPYWPYLPTTGALGMGLPRGCDR